MKRISPKILTQLAGKWLNLPFQFTFIRQSTNQVFRVESSEGIYFLRITPHWNQHALESALDFHHYLFERGVPICEPIISKHGNWVENLDWEGKPHFVRLVKSVPGTPLNVELKDTQIYETWGKEIARMHLIASEYISPKSSCFLTWEAEWETVEKAKVWFEGKELAEYERLKKWVTKTLPQIPGGLGIVHADCNASNFLYDGNSLSIIDIDEPIRHFYLSDVARPFSELRHLKSKELKRYLDAFLKGYFSIRPLEGFQIEHLFWIIRMKSLEAYVWAIELDPKAREEEWIKYMYANFGQKILPDW